MRTVLRTTPLARWTRNAIVRVIATDAAVVSECEIEADANSARAKRSQLVARFEAERIAESEAVTAHIEEIVDVHGQAQPSQTYPGADLAI